MLKPCCEWVSQLWSKRKTINDVEIKFIEYKDKVANKLFLSNMAWLDKIIDYTNKAGTIQHIEDIVTTLDERHDWIVKVMDIQNQLSNLKSHLEAELQFDLYRFYESCFSSAIEYLEANNNWKGLDENVAKNNINLFLNSSEEFHKKIAHNNFISLCAFSIILIVLLTYIINSYDLSFGSSVSLCLVSFIFNCLTFNEAYSYFSNRRSRKLMVEGVCSHKLLLPQ